MRRFATVHWVSAVSYLVFLGVSAQADEPAPEQLDFFEKHVRPVLVDNCFKCHSVEGKQRAKLIVDSREGLLKGGETGPALVPGDPDKSRFIKAIGYADPKLRMPPNSKLDQQHIDNLTKWVQMGAPWPKTDNVARDINAKKFDLAERSKHWAWQPVQRPALPKVKNQKWASSPIDYFLLARLEEKGLAPNPPADKNTLLRRVYFDLIGLPPTPEEIDAFLNDDSPKAFEKVVDKLLASPHYGERWGRHWLDLVRFAETCGHEFDFELPEAWLYRDYVIRAFNDDVPYDQLVLEHIAGDLLPKPRKNAAGKFNESILGTGFWFLGEGKHSPVDVLGEQADRIDNQIDVFSKTFLGMTVSCARCHDHMFDAITTKDYYALMGYLQSARYQRAFIFDPEPFEQGIAQLQQLREKMTMLAVPALVAGLKEQYQQLPAYLLHEMPSANGKANAPPGKKIAGDPRHPLHPWLVLRAAMLVSTKEFDLKRKQLHQQLAGLSPDLSKHEIFEDFTSGNYENWFVTGQAFGTGPSSAGHALFQPGGKPVQQLETPNVAHSGLVSNRLQGALRSQTFTISKKKIHYLVRGKDVKIRLILDGHQLIRNPIYGGLEFEVKHGDSPRWHTQDVSMWIGHRAYVEVLDDGDGWVGVEKILFSDEPRTPGEGANPLVLDLLADSEITSLEILADRYRQLIMETLDHWQAGTLNKASHPAARVELINWLLAEGLPLNGAAKPNAPGEMASLFQQYQQAEAKLPTPGRAMAMADGTPINESVYIRGNHKNKGEEVPRRFLEVFVGDKAARGKGSGRLELGKQIVAPDNPLTARVMVNRIWKHHFGEGIVRSVDNFGVLGELPTHPELLDWLATEFINQGWSIKKIHRLMVLSSAYQMSSKTQEAAKKLDPENKLLHRMPVKRLEGEIIRDALLAVSGKLNLQMYGPGVLPHLTPHMIGRGRPGKSGPLDGDGRRSVYINVRRNFLTPMFLVFDYPLPFTTIGKRSVSNVPAQALTMMNNPFILQQTKIWSDKILAEKNLTAEQRLHQMYLTALGRPPSAAEVQQMLAFLDEQSKMHGQPDDLRAWHDLCHVIVNLKEFIYVH